MFISHHFMHLQASKEGIHQTWIPVVPVCECFVPAYYRILQDRQPAPGDSVGCMCQLVTL